MNNKRNWKIVYSGYSGVEKKAIDLIYKEVGALILRDTGCYTLHVLACENVENAVMDKNAIIIGKYDENEHIRKYLDRSEIPENGYVVKVTANPDNNTLKAVIITALNAREVFYGAVDFVDNYLPKAELIRNKLHFYKETFDNPLPDYYNASSPKTDKRCIFTWAHPINDYRDYIDNMARLRFNQLIMWNDYLPINAKEVVDYAHEYEIEVIWGYAWGWSRNCNSIDLESLDKLTDDIVKQYETEYKESGADGIYFQSFTEMSNAYIGDKLIAEVVTDFVNKTAGILLEKYPKLYIQFGLHATSVKDYLTYIDNVDKRVDIIWEDCGSFPYDYVAEITNMDEYNATVKFTDKILSLRNGKGAGLLYKGMVCMDWAGDHFAHQAGPYIMGNASKQLTEHDFDVVKPIWKDFQNKWLVNGKYVYDITKHIYQNSDRSIIPGVAGQLAGGIWLPEALCAEILWNSDEPYDVILDRVLAKRCITMV